MRRLDRASAAAAALLLLALSASACSSAASPSPSPAPSPASSPSPVPSPTDSPSPSPTPTPSPGLSPSPQPSPTGSLTEEFPRDQFGDPTAIDNEWFPLVPGTQLVYEGEVNADDERVPHRVIFTVTDLTKEIDGVRTVVLYDLDYTAGQLVEAELAFFAQADDRTVWLMGEYPEEYEDGELVDAPTWIAGLQDAEAGIAMKAQPQLGGPSYSQGWGPAVDFTDRARVFEIASRTCVPARCYDDVLVIDEFNPDEPDAHQLKYYAPGLGVVRVGWAGALEESQETLELVSIVQLSPDALAEVRDAALRLEASAYEVSEDVYGRTPPAQLASEAVESP
ncbi:MAG: hypothetical protein A2X23_00030 [Chloroflexi bacterium GWC2_73_18]|nr:MAG: hypothetical protein A2X23_00030 [Chloroflexi bacterium GWC2_73_18]